MTTTYLSGLKRQELVDLASESGLPDFKSLKTKADIIPELDAHLKANQSSLSGNDEFSDYYKKLGSRSPVKRESGVTSGDDAKAKKQRRKTTTAEDIVAATSSAMDTATAKASALVPKTPSRQSLSRVAASVPLPASPAAVSDLMERQTTRLRSSLSNAYEQSGITERVDETRAFLSSAYTVQMLFMALEAYGLFAVILPFRPVVTIPPVKYVYESDYVAKLPDLFQVLKPGFWGPLSLWTSTTIILPALAAYFFNIAHSASTTGSAGGHATRRASKAPQQVIDPLVFNIVKALLVVSVYYYHFDMLGATTNFTIEIVKQSILGGEMGMLTSTGICGLLSVYEAILKK